MMSFGDFACLSHADYLEDFIPLNAKKVSQDCLSIKQNYQGWGRQVNALRCSDSLLHIGATFHKCIEAQRNMKDLANMFKQCSGSVTDHVEISQTRTSCDTLLKDFDVQSTKNSQYLNSIHSGKGSLKILSLLRSTLTVSDNLIKKMKKGGCSNIPNRLASK